MKKNYLTLLFVLAIVLVGYSQDCPTSIRTNGQSTISTPIFTVPNGQNGCTGFPTTILVDGLTYNYIGCNGGNLQYEIAPGQTPPSTFEVAVDFGTGAVCNYDANGDFTGETLSVNEYNENLIKSIKVYPNPVTQGQNLNIEFGINTNVKVAIYSVTGKQMLQADSSSLNKMSVDISSLKNGIYIAQIVTDLATITRKVIVMN